MDIQFVKDVLVQLSGAAFGAFFAVLISISANRFRRYSDSNKDYRNELAYVERYNSFLLLEINIRASEVEGVCETLLLNRRDTVPNISYNILSVLPERDFVESKILSIKILNLLSNQQFRARMINQLIHNYNQISSEIRSAVIETGNDPNRADTYKFNLMQMIDILDGIQIHLREVKEQALFSQANVLAYLSILPSTGMRFSLVKFTNYIPSDKAIKFEYIKLLTKFLR